MLVAILLTGWAIPCNYDRLEPRITTVRARAEEGVDILASLRAPDAASGPAR